VLLDEFGFWQMNNKEEIDYKAFAKKYDDAYFLTKSIVVIIRKYDSSHTKKITFDGFRLGDDEIIATFSDENHSIGSGEKEILCRGYIIEANRDDIKDISWIKCKIIDVWFD